MTVAPLNILLIGFGNMGRALYNGWQHQSHTIIIVDPAIDAGQGRFNSVTDDVRAFKPDLVVMAVKPQVLDAVLGDYIFLKDTPAVVLSIMAGTPIEKFTAFFGDNTPIIRSMPNTPAMVGAGMTVCVGNLLITPAHQEIIDGLLQTVGQVAWVDDENLIHAITGVSGSGPAYVFYMIEAMAQAGVDAGLPNDLAMQLARQTIIGSARLAEQSEETADVLRARVTSPGGTTAAALDILVRDEGGLKGLMRAAIANAVKRSKELA